MNIATVENETVFIGQFQYVPRDKVLKKVMTNENFHLMQWVEIMPRHEIVKGVYEALQAFDDIEIQLYGDQQKLTPLLTTHDGLQVIQYRGSN